MRLGFPILSLGYAGKHVFVCGGGGSAKTGIENLVIAYELGDIANGDKLFNKVMEVNTGSYLAFNISVSVDVSLVAISIGSSCWVFEINLEDKSLKCLIKFRTDFAAEDSEQSCVKFVGNSTIVTGGEDGVVRVWQLSQQAGRVSGNPSAALDCATTGATTPSTKPKVGDSLTDYDSNTTIQLLREYRGHSKRIKQIAVDPFSRNMVASSSEDQSCHLWRLSSCQCVHKLAIATMFERVQKPIPARIQFRCVEFAHDGKSLYTVLSPARGTSWLAKWEPRTKVQVSEVEWTWGLTKAAMLVDEPVGALAVSGDDAFVAVGSASGQAKILFGETLEDHSLVEPHSFAITGLAFGASSEDSMLLLSASADKYINGLKIPRTPPKTGLSKLGSSVSALLSWFISLFMSTLLSVLIFSGVVLFGVQTPMQTLDQVVEGDFTLMESQIAAAGLSVSLILGIICLGFRKGSILPTLSFGLKCNAFISLLLMKAVIFFGDLIVVELSAVSNEMLGYIAVVTFGGIALFCLTLSALFS